MNRLWPEAMDKMSYTYDRPLLKGKLIKRYKRFFADILLDTGEEVVAHLPNTGSMKSCFEAGWDCIISDHGAHSKRKLRYTLELTHSDQSWILVNTSIPNKLIKNAILNNEVPELLNYDEVLAEYKKGQSRIDLFLHNKDQNYGCFVEIKNVTLKVGTQALFPDSVSERGQKHLIELGQAIKEGHRACMFYLISRQDVESFSSADSIDPQYGKLLKEARSLGVEILCYKIKIDLPTISLGNNLVFK